VVNYTTNGRNYTNQRMPFYPETDDYSLLQANGSFYRFNNIPANATLRVSLEVGGIASPEVIWRLPPNSGQLATRFATFFTAVVDLNAGKVQRIYWEDGCFDCGGTGNCINDARDCVNTDCVTRNCDIKFYLAWRGTDTSSQYMTSSGKTISKYRAYSINGIYQSILNVSSSIVFK
jgi:hypothetical protein